MLLRRGSRRARCQSRGVGSQWRGVLPIMDTLQMTWIPCYGGGVLLRWQRGPQEGVICADTREQAEEALRERLQGDALAEAEEQALLAA